MSSDIDFAAADGLSYFNRRFGRVPTFEVVEILSKNGTVREHSKARTAEALGLHPRDVSIFTKDPRLTTQTATITVREGNIFFKTEASSAIIGPSKAILFKNKRERDTIRIRDAILMSINHQVRLPFELCVLEVLLSETVHYFERKANHLSMMMDSLINDFAFDKGVVPAMLDGAQLLQPVQKHLTTVEIDVTETYNAINNLLQDEHNLSEICLSAQAVMASAPPLHEPHEGPSSPPHPPSNPWCPNSDTLTNLHQSHAFHGAYIEHQAHLSQPADPSLSSQPADLPQQPHRLKPGECDLSFKWRTQYHPGPKCPQEGNSSYTAASDAGCNGQATAASHVAASTRSSPSSSPLDIGGADGGSHGSSAAAGSTGLHGSSTAAGSTGSHGSSTAAGSTGAGSGAKSEAGSKNGVKRFGGMSFPASQGMAPYGVAGSDFEDGSMGTGAPTQQPCCDTHFPQVTPSAAAHPLVNSASIPTAAAGTWHAGQGAHFNEQGDMFHGDATSRSLAGQVTLGRSRRPPATHCSGGHVRPKDLLTTHAHLASTMLEAYQREVQSLQGVLGEMDDHLCNTRETWHMQLDAVRNHIILVSLWLSLVNVSVMLAAILPAFFGMNLSSGLPENSPVAFYIVCGASAVMAAASYPLGRRWYLRSFQELASSQGRQMKSIRLFMMQHIYDVEDIVAACQSLPTSIITRQEFRKVIKEAVRGRYMSDSAIDFLYRCFDSNRDGLLQQAELVKLHSSHYSKPGNGPNGNQVLEEAEDPPQLTRALRWLYGPPKNSPVSPPSQTGC